MLLRTPAALLQGLFNDKADLGPQEGLYWPLVKRAIV